MAAFCFWGSFRQIDEYSWRGDKGEPQHCADEGRPVGDWSSAKGGECAALHTQPYTVGLGQKMGTRWELKT